MFLINLSAISVLVGSVLYISWQLFLLAKNRSAKKQKVVVSIVDEANQLIQEQFNPEKVKCSNLGELQDVICYSPSKVDWDYINEFLYGDELDDDEWCSEDDINKFYGDDD